MFRALDISTSGLVAQRHHLDTIAGNIANISTTRGPDNTPSPFQRRLVRFMADADRSKEARGVGVRFEIDIERNKPPRRVYQPGHPDADADGYVAFPDIDLTTEFVNALQASRAYEANVGAVEITKAMISQSLRLLT
jgi:flagellar basal-body rod protein FlgC